MNNTIYTIPAPYSVTHILEVYGDPDNGWYEWRITDSALTVFDTGTHEANSFLGRQYGNPEIALRDALNYASLDLIDHDTSPNK